MQKEIVGKDAFRMGHEQAEERALHWVEVYFQAGFRNQDVSSVLSDTGDELENMLSSCGHCLFFFCKSTWQKMKNQAITSLVIASFFRLFCYMPTLGVHIGPLTWQGGLKNGHFCVHGCLYMDRCARL